MKLIKHYVDTAYLLLIYLAAYLFYRYAMGIHFDITPTTYFMQFLDVELLKHDLLSSLLYLHSQPPLLNFVMGVCLQIGGNNADVIAAILFFILGAFAIVVFMQALALVGVRRTLRLGVTTWLCVFPTFILYANWAYASHVEFSMCCFIFSALARLLRERALSFKGGMQLFIPCAVVALVRSQWHPVFFVAMAGMILVLCRKWPGKMAFARGTAAALSPVLLLYGKNLIVFGFFGASSWMGMNLAEVTADVLPKSEIQMLQERGEVSPFFPVRFKPEVADAVHHAWEQSDRPVVQLIHPALLRKKANGIENYNYLPYVEGSKQDMADSLAVIAHAPMAYVDEVAKRVSMVAQWPSIAFEHRAWLDGLGEWVSRGCLLLYVLCPAAVLLLALMRNGYVASNRTLVLVALSLTAAITVSSSAFSFGGESVRMRWGVAPFYMMCLAMVLEQILSSCGSRKRQHRISCS